MPSTRRTQATGRIALCVALAGWAFAAVSFVVPGAGARSGVSPQSLRGTADVQRFPATAESEGQPSNPLPGLAVFAATVGLAATMVSTPVYAEEVSGQGSVEGKLSRKKKKRESAVKEAEQAEKASTTGSRSPAAEKPKAEKPKEGGGGGGFSLPLPSLPSISVPNNFEAPKGPAAKPEPSEAVPVKPFKKNFINPSEERDYDELPLTYPNPPLLLAILFAPSFIYIAFWVLGSLEII